MSTNQQDNILNLQGYKLVSKDDFLKKIQGPTKNEIQKNAEKLISLLKQVEKKTLSQTPDIVTCIVQNYNPDGTVDVYPVGENDDVVWTIQNQSIYKDIPVGSPVKVLKQDRNNNINMWIGATNNAENKKDILYVVREDELEHFIEYINFLKYKLDCLFELAEKIAEWTYVRCSLKDDGIEKYVMNLKETCINNYNRDILNFVKNLKKTKDFTTSKGLFNK